MNVYDLLHTRRARGGVKHGKMQHLWKGRRLRTECVPLQPSHRKNLEAQYPQGKGNHQRQHQVSADVRSLPAYDEEGLSFFVIEKIRTDQNGLPFFSFSGNFRRVAGAVLGGFRMGNASAVWETIPPLWERLPGNP